MTGKIRHTKYDKFPSHVHRVRLNEFSAKARAGMAQKTSLAARDVPISLSKVPWEKKDD